MIELTFYILNCCFYNSNKESDFDQLKYLVFKCNYNMTFPSTFSVDVSSVCLFYYFRSLCIIRLLVRTTCS